MSKQSCLIKFLNMKQCKQWKHPLKIPDDLSIHHWISLFLTWVTYVNCCQPYTNNRQGKAYAYWNVRNARLIINAVIHMKTQMLFFRKKNLNKRIKCLEFRDTNMAGLSFWRKKKEKKKEKRVEGLVLGGVMGFRFFSHKIGGVGKIGGCF